MELASPDADQGRAYRGWGALKLGLSVAILAKIAPGRRYRASPQQVCKPEDCALAI